MVVDSLRERAGTQERVPALDLLELHDARAVAVALTHPHLDHADGLPRILDRRHARTPVGCLAAYFEPPEVV